MLCTFFIVALRSESALAYCIHSSDFSSDINSYSTGLNSNTNTLDESKDINGFDRKIFNKKNSNSFQPMLHF